MERGHALGARQPGWQHPSADWVKQCRREVELEGKLSKVLSGQDRPADAAERAELASVAGRKGLHAASARLFAEAFAERPALADDLASSRRYNAACHAALAGCGKGRDEPPPGPADRAQLRAQALGWLKADLAAWARHLDGGPTPARAAIVPATPPLAKRCRPRGGSSPGGARQAPRAGASGMAGSLGQGRCAVAPGRGASRTSSRTACGRTARRSVRALDPRCHGVQFWPDAEVLLETPLACYQFGTDEPLC